MSRRVVVVAVLVVATSLLAACSGSASSRTLQWWVLPDGVDARSLAEACAAEGGYDIELRQLPAGVDRQRAEIVRRLSSGDEGIDIVSLDTSLTAEVAAAGYLAEIPAEVEPVLAEDALPKAIEAASFAGRLVAAPWRLDPQLLWFRGTAAERAGLDTTQPIAWDDLLVGAERLGATVQIDDPTGVGMADWVHALVAGAGGTLLDGAGRDPAVGLSTGAGRLAAAVVQVYAGADIGPGPSGEARTQFAGARGGFLLAAGDVVTDPILSSIASDMNAVPYPVVDGESVAPLTGVALAVPADAGNTALAYEAVGCLTSAESQQQMMSGTGHGATRAAVYEAEEVTSAIAASEVMLAAVSSGVNPASTPYWQRVRVALNETWSPVGTVSPSTTPAQSQREVLVRVAGGLP